MSPPKRPLKLVFLSPAGVIGGAEMCLLDLLASFRADRPEWSLEVLLGDDGPLREAVRALDISCDILALPPRLAAMGDASLSLGSGIARKIGLASKGPAASASAIGYLWRLRRWLHRRKPDIVQTNGMKAHVLGAWSTPRGVPLVWHLHDYLGSRAVMRRLLKHSTRPGLRGVAVSRSVAADAVKVLGPGVPVDTIYNAADLDRFAPGMSDGAWLDVASGLAPAAPGTVRVGLVATFARWKGHEVYLDAISKVPVSTPARFYIVGGPLYKSAGSQYSLEELKAIAASRNLGGRVAFAGHQPEPGDVFRSLDVVVHASTRPEPFGRVIVEAMACGRAVVASKTGGAAELFEDGVSAIGCPPGDSTAMSDALIRLIADTELRDSLGAAGRRTALRRFDRVRLAEEWARLYLGANVMDQRMAEVG